ncbi:MAG: hypothetical protein ABH950_00900 [Candidatus Altiarchaeota archaeon]
MKKLNFNQYISIGLAAVFIIIIAQLMFLPIAGMDFMGLSINSPGDGIVLLFAILGAFLLVQAYSSKETRNSL